MKGTGGWTDAEGGGVPPTPEGHSLLTTTAALVDTCPYPFVATAEYVAVSSKFALGERKRSGVLNALWVPEAHDPDQTPVLLKASRGP